MLSLEEVQPLHLRLEAGEREGGLVEPGTEEDDAAKASVSSGQSGAMSWIGSWGMVEKSLSVRNGLGRNVFPFTVMALLPSLLI